MCVGVGVCVCVSLGYLQFSKLGATSGFSQSAARLRTPMESCFRHFVIIVKKERY